MGRGPTWLVKFPEAGPQPVPARQFFNTPWLGRAHKMSVRPHETWALHGPARHLFLGRPVGLTGRSAGRPTCCPVLKDTGWPIFFLVLIPSRFRRSAASGPYKGTTHYPPPTTTQYFPPTARFDGFRPNRRTTASCCLCFCCYAFIISPVCILFLPQRNNK